MTPLEKPRIGQRCNGCGICCMTKVCLNGAYVLGLAPWGETVEGQRPALIQNNDQSFSCGIIKNPKKYINSKKYPADVLSKNFSFLVGAGRGCDQLLEDDTMDEEARLIDFIQTTANDEQFKKKPAIANKVIHGIE